MKWNVERKKRIECEWNEETMLTMSVHVCLRARSCVCSVLFAVCNIIVLFMSFHSHTLCSMALCDAWSWWWWLLLLSRLFFFFHSDQPSVYIFHFIPVCSHHRHTLYNSRHVVYAIYTSTSPGTACSVFVVGNSQTTLATTTALYASSEVTYTHRTHWIAIPYSHSQYSSVSSAALPPLPLPLLL